jgi:hypothetical protein
VTIRDILREKFCGSVSTGTAPSVEVEVIDKEWVDVSSSWFQSVDLNAARDRLIFKSNYLHASNGSKPDLSDDVANDSFKAINQPEDAYVWIQWASPKEAHKHERGTAVLKSELLGSSYNSNKSKSDLHHAVVQSNSDLLRSQVQYAMSQINNEMLATNNN